MQVNNSYLPACRKDYATLVSVTSGCLNAARIVVPQNVFSHINPATQLRDYDEPLPSTKGSGGTVHAPFGVGANRGQQIPQLVMQPPPPLDLGKKSQASNAQVQYTFDEAKCNAPSREGVSYV